MTGKYVFRLSNFCSPAEKIYYTLFLFYVVLFWLFIWQANQSFFYYWLLDKVVSLHNFLYLVLLIYVLN